MKIGQSADFGITITIAYELFIYCLAQIYCKICINKNSFLSIILCSNTKKRHKRMQY